MRPPRATTRHLLLLVALVGLGLGLVAWVQRRADHFRAEAGRHPEAWLVEVARDGHSGSPRSEHHLVLARKYEAAASRPWLSVEPDPPEPE